MFGFLYAAYLAIGSAISGTKAMIENQQRIDKANELKKQGKNLANVYTDIYGHTRDLSTGKSVMIDHINCESEGRDVYLRNQYGDPIRNLSEERRQQAYREARKHYDPRKSVMKWKDGPRRGTEGENGQPYYYGEQYKDLRTGRIYVCRRFKIPKEIYGKGNLSSSYYMNVETGLLVRETDSQKENRKREKYTVPEDAVTRFMEYFNQKQSTEGYYYKSKQPKDFDWNGEEKNFDKIIRLGMYYCNENDSVDVL